MRLVWLVPALASLALAGEAADPATALALPAGGPALADAARTWQADALLALLADPDPARRRGAARLAAALPVEAARLLPALLASDDPEVRRLGAAGLRGVDAPLAELARIPEPATLAPLLATHPAADPLGDRAVATVVGGWLREPGTAGTAARLIAARGTAAAWGEALLAALGHADEGVVAAAHGALQALTRTQRSLEAYAGDRRLLTQDWKDALAAKPAAGAAPDAELMATVAELPAPAALLALLARGPAALAAIERAQAEATRARRRELEPAARLLVHAVPVSLYEALGAEAFVDLDHAEPAARIACLRRLAGEVRTRHDADGVAMLVAMLDDADSGVRATALDQLVRLSDERSKLKKGWKLQAGAAFEPDRTVHRLRRSLRDGGTDEQIAGLLLIGTLEARELLDDVMQLTLAPRGEVVDTALETLARLGAGDGQVAPLARIANDPKAAAARRLTAVKALGEVLGRGGRGSKSGPPAAQAPLMQLTQDADPRIAQAAARALGRGNLPPGVLRGVLERLIARGLAEDAITIAEERGRDEFDALLVARLAAGAADADRAAFALARRLGSGQAQALRLLLAGEAATAQRATIRSAGTPLAGHAVLDTILGERPLAEALATLRRAEGQRAQALAMLAGRAGTVDEIQTLAAATDGLPPAEVEDLADTLLDAAVGLAARAPDRIGLVVRQADDLLNVADSDWESSGELSIRTLTLKDGSKIRLEARPPQGQGGWSSDDLEWKPSGPPPANAPDAAALARLADAVAALPVAAGDGRDGRDLAVAWMRGSEPDPALARAWRRHDDLCRLLAETSPAFRAAVVEAIAATKPKELSSYHLRRWLALDPPRLLPVAIAVMKADSNPQEYEAQPIVALLEKEPPETIARHLPDLLSMPAIIDAVRPLIAKAGPLPLAAALPLIEGNGGELAIAAFDADAAETIAKRLGAWTPPQILARAAAVRRLRTSGTAAVDAALATLIARGDAAAAAWLRSGIPAEAGMLDAYRSAEGSATPELALVGTAFALKEGRLAMPAFLERVAIWPSPVQADAAAAARRYGEGKWAELAPAAAALVPQLGARALASWIAVLPPDPAVAAALAARAGDSATADAMAGALAARMARDPAWKPAVLTIRAAANGRLDWLAP